MLRATSVAIVGASPKPDSFGWQVVRQLLDFHYPGRIVPINPRYDQVEGVPCLSALDSPVDCAAICVADARLEDALADVIAAGARSAIIFGAATGESSSRLPLGARLRELAK